MATNPFYVEPVNPLKALGLGMEAYDKSRERRLADELKALQQEAGQMAAAGDLKGAYGRLLGGGDWRSANTISGLLQDQAAQSHRQAQLNEAIRHHKVIEGQPVSVSPGGVLVDRGTGQPTFTNRPNVQLDDDTLDSMARQYLAGDKSVFTNLGRGAQGAENVAALRRHISRLGKEIGLSPEDITQRQIEFMGDSAAARTLANRSTMVEYAANTVDRAIPIAEAAMEKLDRAGLLPWGKLQQFFATQTGNPDQAAAYAAINTLVNEYARVVSPTGVPTDEARRRGFEMLNSAQSLAAFKAVTGIIRQETAAARAALKDTKNLQRGDRRESLGGKPEGKPVKVENDRPEIVQAREAIAKGADPEKVKARLRQNNIKFEPRDLDMQ